MPAKTYLILSYVICSMLASVSGLALTAQIGSGQAVINAQLTLESIAAAVIAGVSIKGGVGRVEMVALGAILLLTLTDAMDLLRIDPRIQAILLGIIVVLAVALYELSQRRAALAAIFLDRIRVAVDDGRLVSVNIGGDIGTRDTSSGTPRRPSGIRRRS